MRGQDTGGSFCAAASDPINDAGSAAAGIRLTPCEKTRSRRSGYVDLCVLCAAEHLKRKRRSTPFQDAALRKETDGTEAGDRLRQRKKKGLVFQHDR